MISTLIYWLVLVIVVCLLWWVLSQFAPAPIMKVVTVVCVVIVVLSLIWLFLPFAHLGGLPR